MEKQDDKSRPIRRERQHRPGAAPRPACRARHRPALGGWDESLSCCEDYDLWLRSVDRYGPPGFLDTIVALYRVKEHGLGIDSVRSGAHARNQRLVQGRFAHLIAPVDDTEPGGA